MLGCAWRQQLLETIEKRWCKSIDNYICRTAMKEQTMILQSSRSVAPASLLLRGSTRRPDSIKLPIQRCALAAKAHDPEDERRVPRHFPRLRARVCVLKRDDFGFGGVQQHVDVCDKLRSVTCRAATIEIGHKMGVGREMEGGGGASRSSIATFTTQALSTRLWVTSIE